MERPFRMRRPRAELTNMPIDGLSESALEPRAAVKREARHFREVPCVDGSLLARVFFTVQLVGCGHVFGLFARFT
jgi:hypothetical protein